MTNYYTDSANKSLWVLSEKQYKNYSLISESNSIPILTCFAANNNSGYHIGQQISDPKLENSHWKPLDGEVFVDDILK